MIEKLTQILFIAAAVGFALTALITLIRIISGPTILDRIVSTDVLVTTLILIAAAEMIYNEHTNSIAFMIVLAATSAFATVMVARYVRKRAIADDRKQK